MDCKEFMGLLDRYIDGELSKEETELLLTHADTCAACREELSAAEFLKDTLSGMDEDISVPLETQAAWRNAVRTEEKKRRSKKITTWISAVAAVLVLAVGTTAFLRTGMPADDGTAALPPAMQSAPDEEDGVFMECDGESAEAVNPALQMDYDIREKIAADNVESAVQELESLVQEYGAEIVSASDDGTEVFVSISADGLEAFLSAAEHIGTLSESERGTTGETVIILFQIYSE